VDKNRKEADALPQCLYDMSEEDPASFKLIVSGRLRKLS
jgi:hypothetical protein